VSILVLLTAAHRPEARSLVREAEAMGGKAAAFQLDAGNVSSFDRFVDEVGKALGRLAGEQCGDFPAQAVRSDGVYFLTQKLLPLIRDGGRIVNISSGLARFSMPGTSAYGAAKGAIEVLTRYLATELGRRGITANVVAPGAIETDFSGGLVRDNPEIDKRIAGMTALGRVGVPDDVGPMIAALLSGENRWVNGQRIEYRAACRCRALKFVR
jgi:NADP-dependent 3-hydroxy acid dehydrogenase YdfG